MTTHEQIEEEIAANNMQVFMEDGPRLSSRYKQFVVARDPDARMILLGGLGSFGIGQMWFEEREDEKSYPGYAEAPYQKYEPPEPYEERPLCYPPEMKLYLTLEADGPIPVTIRHASVVAATNTDDVWALAHKDWGESCDAKVIEITPLVKGWRKFLDVYIGRRNLYDNYVKRHGKPPEMITEDK